MEKVYLSKTLLCSQLQGVTLCHENFQVSLIFYKFHFSLQVSTIENTQDHKSDLKISGVGFLVKFSEKGKSEIELDYDSTTGLLISRADSRGGGVSYNLCLLSRNYNCWKCLFAYTKDKNSDLAQ